ncbi:MAG: FAD-dependent monooxygenase [Sphingobacteriia bacterium]|nr:FAD-dependent monooxygenase [Sphingobacteriia bacterium]
MKNEQPVVLIGAGLSGSLLAIFLSRRGYKVNLYERRPDMRKHSLSAGRSINLALSERGIHALKAVGMLDEIMELAIPMKGRMIHGKDSSLSFQPYGIKENEVIWSVSRGELNKKLMDLASLQPGVEIFFTHKCTGIDLTSGTVHLENPNGEAVNVTGQTVIGTDGSASALRMDMMKAGRFNYSQSYLEHGYKELTIPALPDGGFQLEKNALHIWPRGSFMMIALPNPDGTFTCTLFFPYSGTHGFDDLNTEEKVLAFFSSEFPDAVPLMPNLTQEFFHNPTASLMTVKSEPWNYEDKVVLLGDAAHAVVPFFGQGMNCSFEDCVELDQWIEKHPNNWLECFQAFSKSRKPNADAIANMALENFIEMRDKVAHPEFLLRKKVEQQLEQRYPQHFISRYALVSFSTIPYHIAQEKGAVQDRLLDQLCANITEVSQVNWEIADQWFQGIN